MSSGLPEPPGPCPGPGRIKFYYQCVTTGYRYRYRCWCCRQLASQQLASLGSARAWSKLCNKNMNTGRVQGNLCTMARRYRNPRAEISQGAPICTHFHRARHRRRYPKSTLRGVNFAEGILVLCTSNYCLDSAPASVWAISVRGNHRKTVDAAGYGAWGRSAHYWASAVRPHSPSPHLYKFLPATPIPVPGIDPREPTGLQGTWLGVGAQSHHTHAAISSTSGAAPAHRPGDAAPPTPP